MIKLVVIDVDGTMTDGGIYYDEYGNEMKKFSVKDAEGFFAAKRKGIQTMILTGRKCGATERRARDLKVDNLFQDVKDKAIFLENYIAKNHLSKEEIGYIGDDVNDLTAMALCGTVGCPSDAIDSVRACADYVCSASGGYGAVREFLCWISGKSDL